jgi:hypothetical protein
MAALRGREGEEIDSFIHSFRMRLIWSVVCCEEAYIVEKVPDVEGKFTETGQAWAVLKALRQNNTILHRCKYINAQ